MIRSTPLIAILLLSITRFSAAAATYSLESQVVIGQEGFRNLYWNRDQINDSPLTYNYSEVTDYGRFDYNPSPPDPPSPFQRYPISLWTSRAAAEAGPGFLRVYSEMEALLGGNGPQGSFETSTDMEVLGRLGLIQSSGNERVTPYFTSGAHATLDDTLIVNPANASLLGQPGRVQLRMRVHGTGSYSQPFFEHGTSSSDTDFDGHITAEGAARITLENAGGSDVGQVLQRFDDTSREFFWDYFSKPFADEKQYNQVVVLDAPITFGTSYGIRVELWVWALVNGHGSVGGFFGDQGFQLPAGMHTAIADFYRTATWDGVAVLDNAGNLVEATVMGSELNYLNSFTAPPAHELPPLTPIPEPATAILAALILLAAGCRWYR